MPNPISDYFKYNKDLTEENSVLDPQEFNFAQKNIDIMTPDSQNKDLLELYKNNQEFIDKNFGLNLATNKQIAPTTAPMQVGETHPFEKNPLSPLQQEIYEKKLNNISKGKRQFSQDTKEQYIPSFNETDELIDDILTDDISIVNNQKINAPKETLVNTQIPKIETPIDDITSQQLQNVLNAPIEYEKQELIEPKKPSINQMIAPQIQAMQSQQNDVDYTGLLMAAMKSENDKKAMSDYSKAASLLGASIAGIKPDYSLSEKIGTGENLQESLGSMMKMDEYSKKMKLEKEMADPNSDISKSVKTAYERAFGEKAPDGLSAKMAKELGLPMNTLLENEYKKYAKQLEIGQKREKAQNEFQIHSQKLKIDASKALDQAKNYNSLINYRNELVSQGADRNKIAVVDMQLKGLKVDLEKDKLEFQKTKQVNDEAKKINKEDRDLYIKTVNYLDEMKARTSTEMGKQAQLYDRALHVKKLIDSHAPNFDSLTPQQNEEIALALASIVAGGKPTESQVNNIRLKTAAGRMGEVMGEITGNVYPAYAGGWVKNINEMLERQMQISKGIIDDSKIKYLKSLKNQFNDQKSYEELMQNQGLIENNNQTQIKSNNPSSKYK